MDKNIVAVKSKKRKHEILGQVIKANGRTVGQVIDGVFVKDVSKHKHFLHTPEAIAYSLDALHAAERAGAEYLDVLDTDTNTHYRASLAMMWDKGEPFNRGWGDQIYLTLSHWQTSADPNHSPTETVTPEYSEPSGTHDVKPLNYKSRAAVGVKHAKGTKTLKQMYLFGGG
jgi:hypothetical protein